MFGKQMFVSGVAAAMVFVGFALAPANADIKEPVMPAVKQVGMIAIAPLNSPETPQNQVYDMTFDNQRAFEPKIDIIPARAEDVPMFVDHKHG